MSGICPAPPDPLGLGLPWPPAESTFSASAAGSLTGGPAKVIRVGRSMSAPIRVGDPRRRSESVNPSHSVRVSRSESDDPYQEIRVRRSESVGPSHPQPIRLKSAGSWLAWAGSRVLGS